MYVFVYCGEGRPSTHPESLDAKLSKIVHDDDGVGYLEFSPLTLEPSFLRIRIPDVV